MAKAQTYAMAQLSLNGAWPLFHLPLLLEPSRLLPATLATLGQTGDLRNA